jgi:hypothetical protein
MFSFFANVFFFFKNLNNKPKYNSTHKNGFCEKNGPKSPDSKNNNKNNCLIIHQQGPVGSKSILGFLKFFTFTSCV